MINNFCKFLLKTISIIILSMISNLAVNAADKARKDPNELYLNKLNFCPITKSATNDYEPEEFSKSNNMLRKAGEEEIFCGQRIVVYGRVVDQNCVPVADAKVYAWQVACDAKYPYKPFKTVANKDMFNTKPGGTFLGNGTATTNNKGEFMFVTVYPKAAHGLGPHINTRVEHRKLGELQTILELKGKKLSKPYLNPDLDRILPDLEESGTDIYEFQIVMPGKTGSSY